MILLAENPVFRAREAASRAIAAFFQFVESLFARGEKAAPSAYVEPRRLTLADQWSLLSGIIRDATQRAEEATRCHASAALQLDLAQYALTSLVDELAGVMDVGGRRRRATVHVLDVAPPRPIGDAIAA